MASLNTLRTKYGIVLSVVIALVLVAFILGDQLSTRGRMSDADVKDNTVMVVDGKEIKQSDYYKYQQEYGLDGVNPDEMAQVLHERIVFDKYTAPAFEAAGIGYTEADKDVFLQMMAEQIQMTYPNLSKDEVTKVLEQEWNKRRAYFDIMATNQRASSIYAAGKYTNSLEVEDALRRELLAFDGHYVMLPYSAITCEEVTAEEIDAYYNAHRQENPRYNARTLKYVEFPIAASEADKATAEEAIRKADEAAKVENADIKAALSEVGGKIGTYTEVSTLDEKVAEAIKANKNYGPIFDENTNTWVAKYIVNKVDAPENFSYSAVTADNIAEANELVAKIQEANGDLSGFENVADGVINMNQLNERNADKFINVKVGDVFTYTHNNKHAAIKITALGEKKSYVLTANVDYKVAPSKETYDAITREADDFMAACGKTPEEFGEAAENRYITAQVSRTAYPSINNIDNSRNVAIWAYDAKVGQKKSWTANNVIYICMVTGIDSEKYIAKNERAIKSQLEKDKKFAVAKQSLTMDTEGVQSDKFTDVTTSGSGLDFALTNAIVRGKEGEPTYVKGGMGVYLFVIDNIDNVESLNSTDRETKRASMNQESMSNVARNFNGILLENVEVEDMRGVNEL